MRRFSWAWLLGIGLLGWSSVAAQAKRDPLPAGVTTAMIAQGKELYEGGGLCFACHGTDGKGAIGSDLTDSVWVHKDGSFAAIAGILINGISEQESKSGTPMPARGGSGLSDDELKAVAAYVWSLSRRKSGP